jgi:hypothetical protein
VVEVDDRDMDVVVDDVGDPPLKIDDNREVKDFIVGIKPTPNWWQR